MDGLIFWIKKNQLLAAVIALIIVSAGYSQFLAGPRNYEDCVLMVVKEAQTESSAKVEAPALVIHKSAF